MSTPADGTTDSSTHSTSSASTTTASPVTFPVEDVLLTVPEIGSEYELVGETSQSISSTTGEQRQQLEEEGIQLLQERSFQRTESASDEPTTVFCSVTVYSADSTAQQAEESLLDAVESSGGTVESRAVLSGYESTLAAFENNRGNYNALFIRREGPVVYYMVASDPDEYFTDTARTLFASMVTDSQSSE